MENQTDLEYIISVVKQCAGGHQNQSPRQFLDFRHSSNCLLGLTVNYCWVVLFAEQAGIFKPSYIAYILYLNPVVKGVQAPTEVCPKSKELGQHLNHSVE